MKVADWTAAALALGWLATVGALAFPGGHPPYAYFVGAGVVLVSFVIAPVGVGAALAGLWRARRQESRTSRRQWVALGVNLLFLVVAVTLWFWIQWEASRR